jgi:hypothetical protein
MDPQSLLTPPIDLDRLATHLDSLAHEARVAFVRAMTPREQADLYEAAKGKRAITVNDIVPDGVSPMREVIHWGRNSLPMFRHFQKRFCRPDDEAAAAKNELWGYNHQTMSAFTGPGYFVAYDLPGGEVLIDYTRLPPRGAPGWPKVISNKARLSVVIYNGTKDTLRGVSKHVTIGRAARGEKIMDNWFVLCRQDP